eukprot:664689-Prymnesium_polylepis.1
MPGEEWARRAGPACMTNEDRMAPSAGLVRVPFGADSLQEYSVLQLTRDMQPGEEITWDYRSDTPYRGDGADEGGAA